MDPKRSRPARRTGVALAVSGLLALALGLASPAAAVGLDLVLDPAVSQVTGGAGSEPLSGSLGLELGALPPLAGPTAFDVTSLAVSGASLDVTLDPGLSAPGLGVLSPGGSFLIPSLHLRVNGTDLTLTDVAGSFGQDCAGATCLQTAFQVDAGAGVGLVDVTVVALVPEPAVASLAGLVALAGWATRARAGREEV